MNSVVGNSQLIQKMNRLKVLNYIRKNPNIPRNIIAKETGLSVASLTNITAYLISAGLLTECGAQESSGVGRKSTPLRFGADTYGLVCISIGADTISVSHTNLNGRIIDSSVICDGNMQPSKVVEPIRAYIASLLGKYGKGRIIAIGISISGLVLDGNRFVVSSSLKWKEFDLKAVLEKDTGLPVFVDNMSLLKAVWYFNSNKSEATENMVFVDMENGIGSCQFYKGEINRAMLGEIGHTTVKSDGEMCFCGNKGCLEAMCSVQRIQKLYNDNKRDAEHSLEHIIEQYRKGDVYAVSAVKECASFLGIGLASLVNICKPSVIVINTGQFTALPELIDLAIEELDRRAYPALLEGMDIRRISVNEQQAICGAATNLCDRLFSIDFEGNIIE